MKKAAIVNRTNLINYGSVLQCFALRRAIESLGFSCDIIWEDGGYAEFFDFRFKKILYTAAKLLLHPSLWKKTIALTRFVRKTHYDRRQISLFRQFRSQYLKCRLLSHREMVDCARAEYDKLVCGSDQVWCSTSVYVDPLMYLRFAPEAKRVAYAPSLGRNFIPGYNRRMMRKYIDGIPWVSIREDDGQELIRELTGRKPPLVLDPTLLWDKAEWDGIRKIPAESGYILCYFLSTPDAAVQNELAQLSLRENKTIIALGRRLSIAEEKAVIKSPPCGPCEFIGYIANADAVYTDSYHGAIFSILYEKDFYSVERNAANSYDQSSRQLSLLRMLGMTDRYVRRISGCEALPPIHYRRVKEIIADKRRESLNYLENSLYASSPPPSSEA